jgi:hypothetical protein
VSHWSFRENGSQFPFTPTDPLIVKTINPVDERAIGQ